MKIIETSRPMSIMERYMATENSQTLSVTEEGSIITYDGHITWEVDDKKTGEVKVLHAIIDNEQGKAYAFQSDTAWNDLMNILSICEEESENIKALYLRLVKGHSKAGREYCSLKLDHIAYV